MIRRLTICSIFLNIILGSALFYGIFSDYYSFSSQIKFPSTRISHMGEESFGKKYAVAIVIPATHGALEEIQRGFEKTLTYIHGLRCTFSTFNANGNRTLLRSQIEEIAQRNFDAVFTIGAVTTQLTKEIFEKKRATLPIIFGAVADPVRLGLVKSIESSGNWLTGAAATTNYALQIKLLLLLKPTTKNVLLVYDPTQSSGLEQDKKELAAIFSKINVKFKAIEVYNVHDVQQKLPLIMNKELDVVMILKDNTVVPCIDQVITLCERYGITVFTTDLDSVEKGAALGFGVKELSFGVDAAGKAFEVLSKNLHPSDVPVAIVSDFQLLVNDKARNKQNLVIDPKLFLLLKSIKVMRPSGP